MQLPPCPPGYTAAMSPSLSSAEYSGLAAALLSLLVSYTDTKRPELDSTTAVSSCPPANAPSAPGSTLQQGKRGPWVPPPPAGCYTKKCTVGCHWPQTLMVLRFYLCGIPAPSILTASSPLPSRQRRLAVPDQRKLKLAGAERCPLALSGQHLHIQGRPT